MSYLSDLLRPEQINLDLKSVEKVGVLQELVALVPALQNNPLQKESFLKALLEREKLHTTAIGDGIALPHTRTPLEALMKRQVLAFGRHNKGVAYGALDNKPVQLLFLLASPNLTEHLAMLARLSRLLRDPQVRALLLAAKSPPEIIRIIDEGESRTGKSK